jgi:heterodisulfide reductase subunit C
MKKDKTKKIDFDFVNEIAAAPGGKDIKKCIQCGTCTSSCAIREKAPGFNPRKIIAKAILGLKDEVLSSDEIWYCARCQYCIANCRKDISPGDIITAIRTVAIREGYKETQGARHTLAFLEDIKSKGKLNEATLPLKTLRLNTIKLVPYALRMLRRGKVPPPFVKSIDGLGEVIELIEEFKD